MIDDKTKLNEESRKGNYLEVSRNFVRREGRNQKII
jgi:hypothetical protein